MNDPRYDGLARLVLEHSLDLRAGQVLRIQGSTAAAPLILALHRAAIDRGAHAYTSVELEVFKELLIADGSDEQLDFVSPIELRETDTIDAAVTIWAESNTRASTRLDAERHQRQIAAERQYVMRRRDRVSRGELRWCGVLCPTNAHAQDAEMSLGDYEEFVFRACHVTDDDPVGHWRGIASELQARAQELDIGRQQPVCPHPRRDGRRWRAAHGRQNMPDGEVYTSPVETGVSGAIRFGFPALFEGREIDDLRLRFEQGRVVAAEAARGASYLNALLEMDAGAATVGEVAFGLNYEIDRFTRNLLFDEKIGGTMHVALGMGFEDLGGTNRSSLHLDLICDLRRDGEVYADGELIWRAGRFVAEPQPRPLTEPAPERV